MYKYNTRKLALAAVLCSFSAMLLIISSIVPTGSMTLLFLSSGIICVIVDECDVRYGLAAAGASSIISMILAVDKTIPGLFILFFGWYPIAKLYIEGMRKPKAEICIKALFGLVIAAEFAVISKLFNIPYEWYWYVLCIPATLGYDYILDTAIMIYRKKIKKHIHWKG